MARITQIHHRRSIRLKSYDYSQAGAYFVTLITQGRECLFGQVVQDEMELSDVGRLVAEEWQKLPLRFPHVTLDASMVMPNHLHGVIVIGDAGKGEASARSGIVNINAASADASPLRPIGTLSGSLGAVIQNFKSTSSRRVNALRQTLGASIWQRNYYEHIIRDEKDLNRIREYIAHNPLKWALDTEYTGTKR